MRSFKNFSFFLLYILFPLLHFSSTLNKLAETVLNDFSFKFYEQGACNIIYDSDSDGLLALASFIDDLGPALLDQQKVNPMMTCSEFGTFSLEFLAEKLKTYGEYDTSAGIRFYKSFETLVTEKYNGGKAYAGQGDHIKGSGTLDFDLEMLDSFYFGDSSAGAGDEKLFDGWFTDCLEEKTDYCPREDVSNSANSRLYTESSSNNVNIPNTNIFPYLKRKNENSFDWVKWKLMVDAFAILPLVISEFVDESIEDLKIAESFILIINFHKRIPSIFNRNSVNEVPFSEEAARTIFFDELNADLNQLNNDDIKRKFSLKMWKAFEDTVAGISGKYLPPTLSDDGRTNSKRAKSELSPIVTNATATKVIPAVLDEVLPVCEVNLLDPLNQAILNDPTDPVTSAITAKDNSRTNELRQLYQASIKFDFSNMEPESLNFLTKIVDQALINSFTGTLRK